ncbi:uncharacterized protein Z518_07903 [Rhinocladiella mackenziei CBS 650.93]|uniref:Xylanolytic transcriptional activator regulatory domain-containing protein n=1 Tax=Rhinocladiella mackenziei CBS 650.93 TaxID=1442369 RepID=A0A0D2I7Z3_9EURO|nr:uncharacterized protein Z518_07903 [Rhinocladiella mackenziei CBS 650.93]KIX01964.1 hypothetical protein Z518_07903 [Rhinocladiella mackenziei CBS 650.93]
MPCPSPPLSVLVQEGTVSNRVYAEFLRVSEALIPPPKLMAEALEDNYFEHLYHRCAVIDRRDLSGKNPSLLLSQATCLAGSLVRQVSPQFLTTCEHLYLKVKTLLETNHEKDVLTVLKAICLASCWNLSPMVLVRLDCSYHWVSIAVRLLLQLGLHRESTYNTINGPGVLRRVAWYIFIQDKLYAVCVGLPAMIKPSEFKIRQLEQGDFEFVNDKSELFIQYVNLNAMIGSMVEVYRRKGEDTAAEAAYSILHSMKMWIHQLPEYLRLYQDSDRRQYRRNVYEIHINYFVAVILFFHLCGHAFRTTITNPTTLIASSCIARLYEEIYYREDIRFLLPMNHWFILVGCLPQIHALSGRSNNADDATCGEEFNILRTALQTMGNKWPQANNFVTAVDKLQKKRSGAHPSKEYRPTSPERPNPTAADDGNDDTFPNASDGTVLLRGSIRDLFPFPESMCPRMAILDSIDPNHGTLGSANIEPLSWDEDYQFNWIFDTISSDHLSDAYDGLLGQSLLGGPGLSF